jgi:hypothetical protein
VAKTFDWTADSARVLVEAVLDGVPGKLPGGEFLGGRVNLARSERPVGIGERPNHGFLNRAGASRDLTLQLSP